MNDESSNICNNEVYDATVHCLSTTARLLKLMFHWIGAPRRFHNFDTTSYRFANATYAHQRTHTTIDEDPPMHTDSRFFIELWSQGGAVDVFHSSCKCSGDITELQSREKYIPVMLNLTVLVECRPWCIFSNLLYEPSIL